MMDFDNDGWKDLFVARSNVIDNVAEYRALINGTLSSEGLHYEAGVTNKNFLWVLVEEIGLVFDSMHLPRMAGRATSSESTRSPPLSGSERPAGSGSRPTHSIEPFFACAASRRARRTCAGRYCSPAPTCA